jgi:hypothetical protein
VALNDAQTEVRATCDHGRPSPLILVNDDSKEFGDFVSYLESMVTRGCVDIGFKGVSGCAVAAATEYGTLHGESWVICGG